MHDDPNRLEMRLQQAAEHEGETPGLPPDAVQAYRRVYKAVREAPMPAATEGFATRLEALTRDHDEQAGVETGFVRAAALAAPVVLGAAAAPVAALLPSALFDRLGPLPWTLVAAIATAAAVAWGIDRLCRPLTAKPAPR
ncbi:hypothetical protein GCM10011521_19680 [Arenimonas soli]|uniref:Uncharacterized protein n=1 Tax=Arenimonas soli TaxID=2269504 RepID=A0ABQ1HLT8_9GAMM|nr:hypothetical protein [Arenimonas soli]GGA81389.1 hypothetical protein GCM10011521_19680 [Arenimonas soli]